MAIPFQWVGVAGVVAVPEACYPLPCPPAAPLQATRYPATAPPTSRLHDLRPGTVKYRSWQRCKQWHYQLLGKRELP